MVMLLDCIGKQEDTSTYTSQTSSLDVFNSCAPQFSYIMRACFVKMSISNAIF